MSKVDNILKVVILIALSYGIFLILSRINNRLSLQEELIIIQDSYIEILKNRNEDLNIINNVLLNELIDLTVESNAGKELNNGDTFIDQEETLGHMSSTGRVTSVRENGFNSGYGDVIDPPIETIYEAFDDKLYGN